MKVSRKTGPHCDIDVTSFSDMAFLLIVFFVLTTTFIKPRGATLKLPSSTSDPENRPEKEMPTINLSSKRLLFNEDEITITHLRNRLMRLRLPGKKENERFVILDCSPDVDFQRYFGVVTAVSKAGGILALHEAEETDKE